MPSIKLFLKTAAALVIVVAAFGPVGILQQTPVAHAQTNPYAGAAASSPESATGIGGGPTTAVGQQGKWSSAACDGITSCLAWTIYWIGPGFASWVMSISAYFFNFIVGISLNSTAYALTFLTTSWTLVLSLANMFFIFILIYAAFTIMLKAETTRTMQILAWVIAIALVVNFSFFFTRVVIDAGNIIATQFYNGITAQVGGNALKNTGADNAPVDITTNIMRSLGAEKPLSQQGFNNVQAATGQGSNAWGALLILTVVFLSTAILFWMLAAGLIMIAVKFLIRIVGLWFVLIVSPLAFVSKTLPKTQRFFDTWVQTLVGFAFYPAIFLFMFYILNMFVADLAGSPLFTALGSQQAAASASDPLPLLGQLADAFVRMGFLLAMFYIMLKAADWIMEQSGGLATNIMNRATGALVSGGFRTAANVGAFAGRNTFGRGAYRLADTAAFKKFAGSSAIGNALWRGTSGISKATFDVRNAPGGSVLKKGASQILGSIDTGKATAKSYDKSVGDREKEIKRRAEALKASESEKRNAQKKYEKEHGKEHQEQTIERNAEMHNREQELQQARQNKARYLENATDKNAATPFDQRINQLMTEQATTRKAQEEAEKKFAKGGEEAAKKAQNERIAALATRTGTRNFRNLGMPSPGSIKGAVAAMKLIKEKSKKEKLAEAAADYEKEQKEEGGTETPSTSTASGAVTPAPAVAHGGGGTAFGKDAGTAHAIEKFTETLHTDLTKLTREQHKTTEMLHNIPTHSAPIVEQKLNDKKIAEQVSKKIVDRLEENK